MWKEIVIENLPRLARFPYQVKSIGYTHNGIYPKRVVYGYEKIEVCIRLFAKKPEAVEYIDSVKYTTKYPHVVLKMPEVLHQFSVDDSRETIHFTYPVHLKTTLKEVFSFPNDPVWEIKLGEQESKLITELMGLMERSQEYGGTDRIDIVAFQLFELLIFQHNLSKSPHSYYETKIRSIASYFQLHFREDINIMSLVARYGMSRSTFIRHWKQFFSETPGQFVLNLKLEEASRVLRENVNIKVSDLSSELNFQDTAYFCALFKKNFKVTPLQYHKKWRP
jgi:AraC-like DNA-binding protein